MEKDTSWNFRCRRHGGCAAEEEELNVFGGLTRFADSDQDDSFGSEQRMEPAMRMSLAARHDQNEGGPPRDLVVGIINAIGIEEAVSFAELIAFAAVRRKLKGCHKRL